MTSLIIQMFCEKHLQNVEVEDDKVFADCPFCGKGRHHWDINLTTGLHFCYRCGARGNFYMLYKHIKGYYPKESILMEETVSELSLETLNTIFSEKKIVEFKVTDWMENTCDIDADGRILKRAREYLLSRNISLQLAKELKIRVAVACKYQNRLIIPIIEGGVVVNFVARLIGNEGKRYSGPCRQENYINKSELLWNFDSVKFNSEVVLVEGIFDAIPLLDLNVAALMGKTLSDKQAEKLVNKVRSVIVMLDSGFLDSAKKIAKQLLGMVPIKIAQLGKDDPGDNPEGARKAIREAVDYYSL